jgi:hypothetical protein
VARRKGAFLAGRPEPPSRTNPRSGFQRNLGAAGPASKKKAMITAVQFYESEIYFLLANKEIPTFTPAMFKVINQHF